MNTFVFFVITTLCATATCFTPQQWAAAVAMPTLRFEDNWPLQAAVMTTPPDQIWNIFRQFGCSVSLLYPTLEWEILDGQYAGVSSANPSICANPPVTSEVGVSYNVTFPGITAYILKVIKVDDYNRERCFQLNGPGAFPGVYATLYTSCSKISLLPIGNSNYSLYQIWANYGLPDASTLPAGTSSVEQRNLFDGFFAAETAQMAATFGNALAPCPTSCPTAAPTPAPTAPPACRAVVTISLQSQWSSNGVLNSNYQFTVQNAGSKSITAVSALLNLPSGDSISSEWNWTPSTGAFSNFGGLIAVGSSMTSAGFIVAGNGTPTVGTVSVTCAN